MADSLPRLFVGSFLLEMRGQALELMFLFCCFLCFVLYDGLGGGYG
jgi:hypothetical protein